MRYPAAETAKKHERILGEATRLFRDRGLTSVSVGEVMKAAGLTHGSFYNHFESKQSLVDECVKHATVQSLTDMATGEKSAAGLDAYVANYLSAGHRDDAGNGCLMSALASEISREPTIRPTMTHYVQSFIAGLSTHFPWPKKTNARREAIQMTATLVGAMILARAVDDPALSNEILDAVQTGLITK